ncbi:MAG TPA: methyltransferase domain-containing protein [Solirubrobacteraceae bacterium]|nr:methyltransferase domain-containing protein [Solirubrobacteraceae bacterium]
MAVSEMWDSVAPGWEANAGFVDGQLALATEALLDAAQIGAGDQVLDLAAGPGGAGLAAAQRVGPTGSVVLSDVAAEMVAVAAKRASAEAQVSTAVFDQSAIDFADASFDAAINRHGLMFVEDPVQTVTEAVRVLRDGGRYAVMTWDRREANPWLGLVLDAVSAQFGVPFPPPNVRGPFSLDTPDLLMSVLRDAGLKDVTVEAMSTPMHAASLGEWWERVPKLAGPLAIALAGMEADVRDAIGERAMQSGTKTVASDQDGIVFEGSVLIGSGHKTAS